MNNSLFNEFDSVSAKGWKQKIQVDLKGADYNKTLIHTTQEGINIKPFYHKDTLKSVANIPPLAEPWQIVGQVNITTVTNATQAIQDALLNGVDAIWLKADSVFDFKTVFDNTPIKGVTIYADFNFLDAQFNSDFTQFSIEQKAQLHLRTDIIGNYAQSGNWFVNNKEDHKLLAQIANTCEAKSTLGVNLELYANAGANAVQQLAYGLAHANEYLNYFNNQETGQTAISEMCFTVACSGNYFMDIAKIRALRLLVNTVAKEYSLTLNTTILATPTLRNKTIYDPNVNMLRTTTECMSAILGGANAICNQPYDAVYHKTNDFGTRISRNQLLILKHESYFNQVSNPADGSYYIEELTQELAQKALVIFKEIEAKGGFVTGLIAGTIQRKIKESAKAEFNAFKEGKLPLLGANLYPDPQEKVKDTIQITPFVKKEVRKTQIEPIIRRRIAQEHEKNRLNNE